MDSVPGLGELIQRLRLYKAPPPPDDDDDGGGEGMEEDVDERGKVFTSAAIADSSSSSPRPQRFRPKRAAVLICLFVGDCGELRVILTKRSRNLSTHSGEVSLPGGKAEDGDKDDAGTATREAKEEIGLDPSLVTIAAVLEPFLSKHLLRVVPVVGILSDKHAFQPRLNASEVEILFDAPLKMFLKDKNHRSEEREWMGEKFLIHYFNFETEKKQFVIWGLTAGILIHAASVVYQQPPSFTEQRPKYRIPRYIKGNCTMP
ncbi:nudix hydrolase 15, mitochondrial-like [Canna indica]|uniref:Nudix hydrolase 15, mitochondrial-like n=1 Tax=Canna indica TaxID=4628 RepID=A0AAQ3L779_9LILI|nr:nudix hydrolase 15, mitochondrial-like [Canna indica]